VCSRTAVFPGSFDPITNGHLDIIRRASRLFDKLIVAVGHNPEKVDVFNTDERVAMIEDLVGALDNVSVSAYRGLTVDFVRDMGAHVIIRGIRDTSDLRDELQAANLNLIVGAVETVFLMAAEEYALTSSTFLKQIVAMGGEQSARLSALVPTSVLQRLREKFSAGR
jgi:pantetheine-phosphate adenylyltransferase